MGNQEYGPPPNSYPDGSPRPAQPRDPFVAQQADFPPAAHTAPQYAPAQAGPPPLGVPYPPQGTPQYPPPVGPPLPPGQVGATTQRNWMGITSLVLGLLGGGILGAVFGGLGISAANEGRATNKTMAIWGLVLNISIPVLLVGGFLAMGFATGGFSDDRMAYTDLAVGECIKQPAEWNSDGKAYSVRYVTRVACNEPHWGQVYHRGVLSGGDYPSGEELTALSRQECATEAAMAAIVPEHFDEAYVTYFVPTQASWGDFDRSVVCFTFDRDHTLAESWVAGS